MLWGGGVICVQKYTIINPYHKILYFYVNTQRLLPTNFWFVLLHRYVLRFWCKSLNLWSLCLIIPFRRVVFVLFYIICKLHNIILTTNICLLYLYNIIHKYVMRSDVLISDKITRMSSKHKITYRVPVTVKYYYYTIDNIIFVL